MRTVLILLLAVSVCHASPPTFDGLGPEAWAERLATADAAALEKVVDRLRRGGSDSIAVLIPLLTHEDVRVRMGAAMGLWRGMGDAVKAIPALMEACGDTDPGVRDCAASALGPMEGRSKPAVPVLAKLLADEHAEVRTSAAWALMRIGAEAGEAIPAFCVLLARDDIGARTRYFALWAVSKLGPAAIGAEEHAVRALADEDASVREFAVRALTAMGAHSDACRKAIAKALEDENDKVRAQAMRAMGKLGLEGDSRVDSLIAGLSDPERSVCMSAARALKALGPAAAPAVPALLASATDALLWEPVVFEAIAAVGEAAVPAILEAMKAPDSKLRRVALQALQSLGPSAKSALPAVISLLDAEDPSDRMAAAGILGKMGKAALPAAGRIAAMLKEPGYPGLVAAWAHWAITGKAGPALETLKRALAHEDVQMRGAGVQLALEMGEAAAPALDALKKLRADENLKIREHAAALVARLDSGSKTRMLGTYLRSEESRARRGAAEALAQMGSEAAPLAGELSDLLDDSVPGVRTAALRALSAIGKKATPAVAKLLRILEQGPSTIRLDAIVCLGCIGTRDALPALERLLTDEDEIVRILVAAAIWRITGDAGEAVRRIGGELRHKDWSVRWFAVRTLGRMGRAARPATVRLAFIRKVDGDPEVRSRATLALRQITRGGEDGD